MNTNAETTRMSAPKPAFAQAGSLLAVLVFCLTLQSQPASCTVYNVFSTKPSWPAAWQALPGLVTSAENPSLSESKSRLDFVGNTTYPTAFYAYDADYVYFRVRINSANPVYPSSSWAHTIEVLIDNNNDSIPDNAFSWDTKGSGTDHQLELNIPDPSSPNTTSSRWNTVNMIDRDGSNSTKTQPDFNTISGHTTDGYVRLVSQQAGPDGASTTTFVDFAVNWAYLTGTYNSAAISSLAPGQTWRVQFASINDGTDHANINADVAGSATLTTTLGTAGAWSDPMPTDLTANPVTVGRAWGTFLRVPVAMVLANSSGGTGTRTLQSVTSADGDYVQIIGADVLFAPAGNATRILNYTVADASTPTAFTASSTITVSVTNAFSTVNGISSSGDGVTITFAGVPGYHYLVERSSSAADWSSATIVQTTNAPAAGLWTYTEASPPNPSFYRTRQNN